MITSIELKAADDAREADLARRKMVANMAAVVASSSRYSGLRPSKIAVESVSIAEHILGVCNL